MNYVNATRIGGVLMLGVFALNVYIAQGDTVLKQLQPLHWDLNWVIAIANLVAALLLLTFPKKIGLVILSGVIWPVVYVLSLAVDVYTKLCIGGIQANCWPSKTAAFDYLILNQPSQGWVLFQGTVILILALLFVTFVISIAVAYKQKTRRSTTTTLTPSPIPPPTAQTNPPQ